MHAEELSFIPRDGGVGRVLVVPDGRGYGLAGAADQALSWLASAQERYARFTDDRALR